MDLKPYHKLACADMSVISQKIHALVADRVAAVEDARRVLEAHRHARPAQVRLEHLADVHPRRHARV